MAKRLRKLTLGKALSAIGLFWYLAANILRLFGLKIMTEGAPYVIGVCLLGGGLVVYALEKHRGEQRLFAGLGAFATVVSLIEGSLITNVKIILIILTVQLVCPAIIMITGKSRLKLTLGIVSVVLAVLVFVSGLGWLAFPAARVPEIAICAIYAITGAGMIM